MSVTLKDVAEKLGVTITTVHKALNGKEGVSEKRRAEIMKVAAQMGYKVNYMASSLSKKKFHIAVVLPNTDGDNRFYYGALWDGIRNYLDTVSEFPITVSEYAYPLTRDGNGLVLEKIFNQDSDDLQGLITIAMDHDRSSYFLEKFAKKQIPVVLIGADLHTDFRLCCIKANGDILPCVLLDIPIGNIRENSFSTIWLNSPILEELNNRQKYSEPCVQCIYVEKCGGCRGVAYGSFGDFFAPDPHCWLDSNGERL